MNKASENNYVNENVSRSLEIMLGIALFLFAYDYARDFFSGHGFDPTNLGKTSFGVFMSRWITYFGAPILMLVAGINVALKKLNGWSSPQISVYLLKRALFLLFVDLVIVSFAFNFSFNYPSYFMMLSALGFSYIILAVFVYLPFKLVFALGLLLVLLSDLVPVFGQNPFAKTHDMLVMIHGMGTVKIFGKTMFSIYSLVPWLGVVLLGYGLGFTYKVQQDKRKTTLLYLGAALTVGFVVLRYVNDYGNPDHWWSHSEMFFTFLSFINVEKFPASVQFLLMTLGPVFMLLPWLEGKPKSILNPMSIYGRTSLFFYVFTVFVLHIFAVLAGGLQGFSPLSFIAPIWQFPKGYGFDTFDFTLFTIAFMLASYRICRLVDSALQVEENQQNDKLSLSSVKAMLRNI